jgi:hypothetical protein
MLNINVFVDARMYEQQLIEMTGSEYKLKKSYSITPIRFKGAFHPKIFMAFGKSHGFLAVGSGNLTNSGLSSNDEIWGAVHTHESSSPGIGLFKSVYQYLEKITALSYKTNREKFGWITRYSKWLVEVLDDDRINYTAPFLDNGEVFVLQSFADNSIYRELLSKLPSESPEKITIISPFYNSKGEVLESLLKDLEPKKMEVVLDPKFGTAPYRFKGDKQVQFYKWEDVITIDNRKSPYLHAKIIQIEYNNETYFLLGSPNATQEAFGTITSNSINAEVSFLVKSGEYKNWLEDLGINIPEKGTYQLSQYKPEALKLNKIRPFKFQIFINHVELDDVELSVYYEQKENNKTDKLVILDRESNEIITVQLEDKNPLVTNIKQEIAISAFKIFFADKKGNRVSNFGLIHHTHLLQNSNPDEARARFLDLISRDELTDMDFSELLDYAHFEKDEKVYRYSSTRLISDPESKLEERDYKMLSEDEINKNEAISNLTTHGRQTQLSQLEDFLNTMTFGSADSIASEDLSDSFERAAEESKETGLSGGVAKDEPLKLSFTEGLRQRRIIHNTLKRIEKFIDIQTVVLPKKLHNTSEDSKPVSFVELQAVLVGSYLFFLKIDEHFNEERLKLILKFKVVSDLKGIEGEKKLDLKRMEDQSGSGFSEVSYTMDIAGADVLDSIISKHKGLSIIYIDETPGITEAHRFFNFEPIIKYDKPISYSVKGFLINVFCPFMFLMYNGVEKYEGQEKKKFELYKSRLFYRMILLTLITHWKDKEDMFFKLILLNTFFLLKPKDLMQEEIIKELDKLIEKISFKGFEYEKNKIYLMRNLDSYMDWDERYTNNKKSLIKDLTRDKIGRILFKQKYGFASIFSIYRNLVNLNSPLGKYNIESKNFEFRNVTSGSKGVFYF